MAKKRNRRARLGHDAPERPVDDRITWVRGDERAGPRQTIGVLELRQDGACRVALAERTQIDGRCHVLLARKAWGGKDALATRWWSLVLDADAAVTTVRNGSCGDRIEPGDVARIVRALESLALLSVQTTIFVDDGRPVFPGMRR
ncbi:MAG: hypothetical protein KIT14_23075 [bacterium]|nr:hypothetical protein [bacterium]